MYHSLLAWMMLVCGVGVWGCTATNDACAPRTSETVGSFLVDLDIRAPFVGQCEAPVGNLLADALLHFDYDVLLPSAGRPDRPTLAFFPAGLVSDRIECGAISQQRSHIPAGPISDRDLQMLLAEPDDRIIILDLGPQHMDALLERAVSRLGTSGESQPADYFLHVSGELGIRVDVDCTQAAQEEDGDGKPVVGTGARVLQVSLGPSLQGGITSSHYVAVPESMMSKESNGFSSLLGDGPARFLTPYRVSEVVRDWLEKYASSTAVDEWMTYPEVEKRLDFVSQGCLADACRPEAVAEPATE